MSVLKPCPFCGSKAELRLIENKSDGFNYNPRCTNKSCCGRSIKQWESKEYAIYAWNKRKV